MGKRNLSYAEAYTDFIKYCSDKERIDIDTLIKRFRSNGVEVGFRMMYNQGIQINNAEYYKRLRGK